MDDAVLLFRFCGNTTSSQRESALADIRLFAGVHSAQYLNLNSKSALIRREAFVHGSRGVNAETLRKQILALPEVEKETGYSLG